MAELLNDNNQIQHLKNLLHEIILNDIFQKERNLYDKYPIDSIEKLRNMGLIRKVSNGTLDGEVIQVEPWLKTRIFEEVIASEGLNIYLIELLRHEGKDSFKVITLNRCLATTHLASSMNKFVFQFLNNLDKKNSYLSEPEMKAIGDILYPNKNYTLSPSEIKFDFDLIEDLRVKIQEYIYNNIDLSEKRKRGKQIKKSDDYLEIPKDIKLIESLGNFNYNDVVDVAKPLIAADILKIIFLKGTIVWIREDKPNIYITNGKMAYSPSVNSLKNFSKEDVQEEIKFIKNSIIKYKTKEFKQNVVPCNLCGHDAEVLAYHNQKGFVPVCGECFDKPEIVASIEAKIKNK